MKDFPHLVEVSSYHSSSPSVALTLHVTQSPFSRALNHVCVFRFVLFQIEATVLNHMSVFESFYPQAFSSVLLTPVSISLQHVMENSMLILVCVHAENLLEELEGTEKPL